MSVHIIRKLAAALAAIALSAAATRAPDSESGRPVLVAQELPPATPASGPGDTLRLADVVALVRNANASVQAARLRAEADRERVSPAGALPDPMLELGLMNRPLDDFGTDERMTMNVVGLRQMIPWPGNQGFSEQARGHTARAAEFEFEETVVAVIARTKSVYARLAYLDRAIGITAETRDLLRSFLAVAESRYASGAGVQQDLLQAQVAVGRTTADVAAMEQERIATAARLIALVGRPAGEPIPAVELPHSTSPIEPLDTLMALAAERRPALEAARERALAAEAEYRAAGRARYPDVEFRIAWGQRPDFVDMGSVSLGVSLPLWGGSKQAPLQRAAAAETAEENARALDLHYETWARLGELRASAERARTLEEIYRVSILPQAEAAVESALAAYRVGRVDYATLLD
ncbi:MAG: TolC family protein, partial [Gemmatimonadetes bacterium]|nr:TolC family protein [Gemmatimonadota bacterium]